MKCIDCPHFGERHYFPHTGGTAGRCTNTYSPKYGQWTVGAWGCQIAVERDLFND